jgi:hypothetical protein
MNGFNSMLAKAKVSDEKKKDGVAIVTLDAANSLLLSNYLAKKKASKEADTALTLAETPLLTYLQEQADDLLFAGKTEGTLDVISADAANKVKFIIIDKVKVGDIEAAKANLGQDIVDKLATLKTVVTLKEEVLENETLQAELTEKLGDSFAKFFEVKQEWKAVKGAKTKMYELANKDKGLLSRIKMFFTPCKPSIK